MHDPAAHAASGRTFSYRAAVIGLAAMLFMAVWIHVHDMVMPLWIPVPVSSYSPPAAVVGIFLGVMIASALVALLRNRLRLRPGELVVIYTMLVTSAPLMSGGMWHRFVGLVTAIPHHEGNLVLMDSFSEKLWPHGPPLIGGDLTALGSEVVIGHPPQRMMAVDVAASPIGATRGLQLINPPVVAGEGGVDEGQAATLRFRVPRVTVDRVTQLVPGERYYITMLVRLSGLSSRSRFDASLVTDSNEAVPMFSLQRDTTERYSQPGGFVRIGQPYLAMPPGLDQFAELRCTLQGPGEATIVDVTWYSSEALHRMRKGSTDIAEGRVDELPEAQRSAPLVRPDNLRSPAGWWYVLKGYRSPCWSSAPSYSLRYGDRLRDLAPAAR